MKKMLFIDRDGTIIKEPTDNFQVDRPEKLEFMPGVLTSSMRTPKPIIKQWCDPLMTFHKHCSCYSLLTLR